MKTKLKKALGNPWFQRGMILAVIMVIMAIFQRRFFSLANANSVLLAVCLYGTMACGMLFPVLMGGIDLSVGSTAALSAAILATFVFNADYSVSSFIFGVSVAVIVAATIGILHAILVKVLYLPAFVVTLATQYFIYGAVQWYTNSNYIYCTGGESGGGAFTFIGTGMIFGFIPFPVAFFVIIIAICAFLLTKTLFGRKIYIAGGNPAAAELIGVKSGLYTVITYIICSVFAGCAGMLLGSMNAKAGAVTARGYEGLALMALVVGGINLAGGHGGIGGVIFGTLLVGIITNMLTLLGVSFDQMKLYQGIIIIAAVSLNEIARRKSLNVGKRKQHV